MNVLLIAPPDAPGVAAVTAALLARGARPHHWDAEAYPAHATTSLGVPGTRARVDGLDVASFGAVWRRNVLLGATLPAHLEPSWRSACIEGAGIVVAALLARIEGFQLDPWWTVVRADNKPLQLAVAARVGLEVPPTLVSNDPDDVRAFHAEHGRLIMKMPTPSSYLAGERARSGVKIFTSIVTPEMLSDDESIRLSPMVFQPEVPKAFELRVAVVGRQVYAARIDSQEVPGARLDWRREWDKLKWYRYELPRDVAAGVLRVMDELALNFGVADFIVTPDGRHVFLEVNPSGEFAYMDRHHDLAISASIADVLLGRAPRR